MNQFSNVDSFLEKLQSLSPSNKKRNFEKKRMIERVYLSAPTNMGRYQILPIPSVISGFPYVSLANTREISMPRRNVTADGQEQNYQAWIKFLPLQAYTIKDQTTGREVSSLTASDESLLRQAYAVWEELFTELDAKNNATDPTVRSLIRRKNYTIFYGNCPNFWSVQDTRTPVRQNFNALFVMTSKAFPEIVGNSIADTNITSGIGNDAWLADVYNRELTGRKGFMLLNISKSDGPGFNISVSHTLGAEAFLNGVNIDPNDMELMQNPVETFLGWQANREDESVPADQRRLFNKSLIQEAIEFMTDQLAKIRMAKQNGTSVEEAIQATNQTALANQAAKAAATPQTNDPILAQMSAEATPSAQSVGGYGNNNVVQNGQSVTNRNDNPFQNPAASHIDPLTGAPVADTAQQPSQPQSAPFSQPSFAGSFGGGANGLPF